MIHINNLHKRFGDSHVLRGISCDIKPQEVVCIIGPSGSGEKHLPALHERPGDGQRRRGGG
ncbi:histidine ABC transporter ATP-binding protein [Klebsiella pneumoniae]|uniref:Histidine ABC transporter ATP-binding protein n=1 Tax=Klebsiella pneumoniae TaxID=573 RepID=A0A378H1R0_KLEPN|nr:histidine ABC transporter ATP-binding protein [Klebsiella pneumoniae]